MNDTHIVKRSDVVDVIKEWARAAFPYWDWNDFERDRFSTVLHNKNNGVTLYSPPRYIAEQAKLSQKHVSTFMKNGPEFITYRKAEKLLMAIEREYLLGTKIKVYPVNPNTNT